MTPRPSGQAAPLTLGASSGSHDTGQVITSLTIPFWCECIALACRAHDLIEAQAPVIGWDVAVLERGPVLVEPNHLPCENLAQMPAGFPLGASPFAEVVSARLRESFLDRAGAGAPQGANARHGSS